MIKKHFAFVAVVAWMLLGVTPMVAQNGLNAPYSQYGVGMSNTLYSTPWAAAMGGVVYTQHSNTFINPYNPASYATIGMQTFLFDMGLGIESTLLTDTKTSLYDAEGSLAYIAGGFALTGWWKTTVGIMPYSQINYRSVQSLYDPQWDTMRTSYEGYGGINRVFWGHGFNIGKNLSVGVNMNLLTGALTRAITYSFGRSDSIAFMNSRKQKETRLRNITVDVGAQYRTALGERYALNVGVIMELPRTMMVEDNALVYTFVTNNTSEYMRDTIFPLDGEQGVYNSTLEQPLKVGVGVALERNNLWQVAADVTYAPWSGMKYTEASTIDLFGATTLDYGDNLRVALGAQWMGDRESSRYINRMGYSTGFHYEQGKLRLQADATCINEWGLGAGIMFPMRKGRSALRLTFKYSSMGTVDMLRRNAFMIGISVGSSESWFVKRKYN